MASRAHRVSLWTLQTIPHLVITHGFYHLCQQKWNPLLQHQQPVTNLLLPPKTPLPLIELPSSQEGPALNKTPGVLTDLRPSATGRIHRAPNPGTVAVPGCPHTEDGRSGLRLAVPQVELMGKECPGMARRGLLLPRMGCCGEDFSNRCPLRQLSQQFKKNALRRQNCNNPRHQGANYEVHGMWETALHGTG